MSTVVAHTLVAARRLSLRSIPSWLASLILHSTALVILVLLNFDVAHSKPGMGIDVKFDDGGA